ncbi:hypothetical protein E2C01_025504 [Portunus trituberculatus]|uniref:Uncharacterized protein n=1 Tax=Portunus trituberculatus TaxID=210409 RepID=A0A5B7EG47_PORTR|nr:hypothetical protein [Portunus trituberculatus]
MLQGCTWVLAGGRSTASSKGPPAVTALTCQGTLDNVLVDPGEHQLSKSGLAGVYPPFAAPLHHVTNFHGQKA